MLFNDIYNTKRVFLTGLTGFKGTWLAVWLKRLGATVRGFSKAPHDGLNHLSLLELSDSDFRGDIRDEQELRRAVSEFDPQIVFHLAAQPLVRRSYDDPLETFSTNVQGTANLLQACRESRSLQAVVVITTDKVYENREWSWGYRESDVLGGHDPYAASKACAELVVSSFRKSFLESQGILLGSCRAGNVIGGGDWAEDRLIPDLMRAAAAGATTSIRMPEAVRPWQHVLEPLAGYLLLGQKLLEGGSDFAEAWNFGPEVSGHVSVGEIIEMARRHWSAVDVECVSGNRRHETTLLSLDCAKARRRLDWRPLWDIGETVRRTVEWYRDYYENGQVLTHEQLEHFIGEARTRGTVWTRPEISRRQRVA